MTGFTLRDGRLPEDEPAIARFIDGLQAYEYRLEPDRRVDAQVGTDYLAVLLARVREREGRIFVAEQEGQARGWSVFLVEEAENYVVAPMRRYGYVAELFVDEALRGQGAGKALIQACESEARARGLPTLFIGVLAANRRAASVYADAGFEPYAMELRKRL